MPVRRRAELVAVLSWRLVCSCIILVTVRYYGRQTELVGNIPLIGGHSILGVFEVEVVGEVVLSGHGLGEVVGNINGSVGGRHGF